MPWALAMIGDDPRARYAFFKKLLAVAQEEAGDGYLSWAAPSTRRGRGLAPEAEPVAGRSHCTSGT